MDAAADLSATNKDIVLAFVSAINSHDIGHLTELLHDEHRLIDSLGSIVTGKAAVRNAWIEYFFLVPDFIISFDSIFSSADTIALTGRAEGTIRLGSVISAAHHWKIPAAWRAVVRGGKVLEWQIFADNEPVRRILGAGSSEA